MRGVCDTMVVQIRSAVARETTQKHSKTPLLLEGKDGEGHAHQSAASVYVTRQGELWFGGEDHDRMERVVE